MAYRIKVDYTTDLVFEEWDDFINTVGYLFQGGIDELRISKDIDKTEEVS